MSTRIPRLWQPGNPKYRVFLPDFWVKLVESPSVGPGRLPKNACKFEVDPRMSRHDVREYLDKIYELPVRDVRIQNVIGEIEWDHKRDAEKRMAIWKEEDKKFAYVFFKKTFVVEWPRLFHDDFVDTEEETVVRHQKREQEVPNEINRKYINKDRGGVGEWWGI
uniref:Large ribosomal subunit protein uL23m n=1 Tax=Acrobeloides nanus TaxID=290746 RepID=A0A914E5T3_9BILA